MTDEGGASSQDALRERLRALSPEQREKFLQRFRAERRPTASAIPRRVEADGGAPLSFAQERFWFLHRLIPEDPTYNMPAALRLEGSLDQEALTEAFRRILSRHEVLRARFVEADGGATQVTAPVSLDLQVIDVGGGDEAELEAALRRESRRPCRVDRGEILRVKLFRLSATEHVLSVVIHHIAADGWSIGILVRELVIIYDALVEGREPDLPPLPVQYADFAAWERDGEGAAAMVKSVEWWKEHLAGAPPILDLPTDLPRPAVRSGVGGRHEFSLGDIGKAVEGLCRSERVTPFVVFLAAYYELLHRYSRQTDLVVGTPVSGRRVSELEPLIGCFVNTVPYRLDRSGNPSFRELLARVRGVHFETSEHDRVPFERIVEELHPERDMSITPLFQALFIIEPPTGQDDLRLRDVRVTPVDMDAGAAHTDITLSISGGTGEGGGEARARIDYSSDLFEEPTITRFAAHYRELLEQVCRTPEKRLSELELLRGDERRQVLEEWNATARDHDREVRVEESFADRARRHPDAVAVVSGEEQLTYGELDRASDAVAHALHAAGVGPGDVVGLCVDRGPAMMATVLGTLKSGGSYLPLDPSYPPERLSYMVADSGAAVVLVDGEAGAVLGELGPGVTLLDVGDVLSAVHDTNWSGAPAGASDVAYVLYTSGSTGRPKGVMVEHRQVTNFFCGMDERVPLEAGGVWLAVTSLSFDISVLELLWTLTRGMRVVISRQEEGPAEGYRSGPAVEMSLFYFASDEGEHGADKYRLLIEGAKLADREGLSAVWTPERHFHAFGGLYPNPSVASAAIAAVTERVGIRAGSCVIPLHNPVRVAEEWSLVDNLSNGRVGISFASGWHPNDFVFAPDVYEDRHRVMMEGIETVRRLWRGETVTLPGPNGPVEVRTLPRPVQQELPFWLTAAGNPKTFEMAGRAGANLLTHLLGQSVEELREKIALYREARRAAGHEGEGHVTLMLHTFLGESDAQVREYVREPMKGYLKSAGNLMAQIVKYDPAIQERAQGRSVDEVVQELIAADMDQVLDAAFERYYQTNGLFGTPRHALSTLDRVQDAGVDEVACLIDFGVESTAVLEHLKYLSELRQLDRRRRRRSEDGVGELLMRHAPTHLQCTPSHAQMLLMDEGGRRGLRGLRHMFVGGEALPLELASDLRATTGGTLSNMYGPTETTIWSSTDVVSPEEGVVTLGRPIANTELYVLDGAGHPVPVGVAGELHIAGEGVTRGYLGRPSLTADRFVPDPFSGRVGGRMYRTGDLVRYRRDGRLEFLGRVDHQVKVRGHRIELGEIENALREHAQVRQAVVTVDQAGGDARLVAYVVCGDAAPPWMELREHLASRLPSYMVPALYVVLDELPLTPNGKIDRKALPRPESAQSAEREYVAPRTAREEELAAIWSEVLGVERVGVEDNFFTLGGHSLQVVRLAAEIRTRLGVQVELRDVFQLPTVGQLAQKLGERGEQRRVPALERVPRDGDLPLSFSQERHWILYRLDPESAAYNEPMAVRLRGSLEGARLKRALEEVVARHEVLRTRYLERDGRPLQIIEPRVELPWEEVDLRGLSDGDREAELRRHATELGARPFDLERELAFRLCLYRLAPDEHALLLVTHHIAADGWAKVLILREMTELYESYGRGENGALPPAEWQYVEYASWQRRWLADEELERQRSYWTGRLRGAPPVMELPTDRQRPVTRTFAGGNAPFEISAELAESARRMARGEGSTLFMALSSAFQLLVSRYARSEDVVVGTVVANRRLTEMDRIVGSFVNTLVLRTDLSGDPTCRELMGRVGEVVSGAFEHQDYPFERLVGDLVAERSLSTAPLVQVLIVLQRPEESGSEGLSGELEVEPFPVYSGAARFDLSFDFTDHGPGRGISGRVEYASELFDAETIERMVEHFQRLLRGLSEGPDRRLSELELLDDAERAQVLGLGRPAQVPSPTDRCLHDLFEEQARARPDATAVVCRDRSVTYGELESSANRLAHRLRREGVGPETRVAILLLPGIEAVVSILAVLKAGGAYLPLDPHSPAPRLAYMLEDSGAPLMVTESSLASHVDAPGCRAICVDRIWAGLSEEPSSAPSANALPSNTAYVIYTSGSTGQPKGVEVEHAGVVSLLSELPERYGIEPGCHVLQLASLAFDASVEEVFKALTRGARLCIAGERLAGEALAEWLSREEVTHATLPPSVLATLDPSSVPSLRAVVTAGEACTREVIARWSGRGLRNGYGPTETTVCATVADALVAERPASIGRPVSGKRVHVLDEALRPVPVGMPGEICIGGMGVARGYLGRRGLTAERFVPDPYGESGERLYRTGDLGRWSADGQLEFLGRVDEQVKIRGHRIEPGEIESVLQEHGSVVQAVVVARPGAGGKRLVGYVTLSGDASTEELREHVSAQVPDYMVPSTIVVLDAIPLTSSGKVDRRALPEPEWTSKASYVAPSGDAEALLAEIWQRVLGVERVGVRDSFFELGGDSILAMQVVWRAKEAGLHLTARDLFEHPTVERLVALASERGAGVSAEQGRIEGEVGPTPIQRWFFERNLAEPSHWNQGLLLSSKRDLDPDVLQRAIGAVVEHHDMLRARYRRGADGAWTQDIAGSAEGAFVLRVEDLSRLAGEERTSRVERVAEEVQGSLSIEEGPLCAFCYLDFGRGGGGRLLIAIHHLVVDGVSWRILLEDLQRAYESLSSGERVRLPAKTTSYRRWSERLREEASSEESRAELAYWQRQVGADVPELPVDGVRDAGPQSDADEVFVELDAERTKALLREVPAVYRTQVEDALLAALVDALEPWTGRRRARIELESHGRHELLDDVDVSRTVGWFTSTHPVVLDLEAARGPGDGIDAVKAQLRAVPRHGLGYGVLRYLSPERAVRESLQWEPEVLFNYLGQLDQALSDDSAFEAAPEDGGSGVGASNRRSHLLELNALVSNGKLRLSLRYSRRSHRRETMEALGQRYVAALEALVSHCRSADAGSLSAADFPLAELGEDELAQVITQVREATGRVRIEDIYRLAPMQEGLLFEAMLAPDSSAYLEQFVMSIEGPLDVDALRRAWEMLLERHPVLRTSFHWEGVRRPVQVVHVAAELPLTEVDWRSRAPGEHAGLVEQFLQEDRESRVDFHRPPVMRLSLLRSRDDLFELVWTTRHLLLDGWSAAQIIGEAFAIYAALRAGRREPRRAARPFSDYIRWLGSRSQDEAETFWRRVLADVTGPTPLPMGRPAPEGALVADGEVAASLAEDESRRLVELARGSGTTLATLVQAAWGYVLSRYGRTSDVLFGAVVAGRPEDLAGAESMVGLFINTLPLRVEVDPALSVTEWLQAVQRRQVEMQRHSHVPLPQIQRWSGVPAGEPLFESGVVFENYPMEEAISAMPEELRVEGHMAYERTHFALGLVVQHIDTLDLRLQYQRARFDDVVMEELLKALRHVLLQLAEGPERPIGSVQIVTADEEARIAREWSQGPTQDRPARCVHELVEGQAQVRPDATAVVCEDHSLSYAELDAAANRLAHRLRREGVGPEKLVALFLESSVEAIVSMLAVLKAGGAYASFDANTPPQRLEYLLDDSGASLVLTTTSLSAKIVGAPRVLCVDAIWGSLTEEPCTAPQTGVLPTNAGYVIYTSGSTGRPKGVVVPHAGLTNLVEGMGPQLGYEPGARLLQFSSFNFDVSVWEILGVLALGGSVVIAPGVRGGERAVEETIRSLAITTANITPSVLATIDPTGLATLRCIVTGGEACSVSVMRRWARDRKFINAYGPTEATSTATLLECRDEEMAALPLGRAIENVRVYVLDEAMRPCAVGMPGEICIGGQGVARGYIGRPGLTAERFVPDPHGEAGERMYRTGDLGCWGAHGQLEFLGRLDDQVQVRGHRVEPDEIQIVLQEHPSVVQAVVIPWSGAGGLRLAAYVTLAAELSVEELREHASERLPEYMVPSTIVVMDEIPLTAVGKVDRRALQEPEWVSTASYVAPTGDAEALLAEIWQKVLGVERVGLRDSFFELGGDSILAMQVVWRAKEAGLHLTARDLFEHPTVERLVALASERGGGVSAEQGRLEGEVGTTPIQRWFFEQELSRPSHWNQAMLFAVGQDLDASVLRGAIGAVVEHHDMLRARYRRDEDGTWAQEVTGSEEGAFVLRVEDLSRLAGEERSSRVERVAAEVQASLSLEEGPLCAFCYLDFGRGEGGRLLIVIHHLVVDGVSWRILLEDLQRAYASLAMDERVRLPGKTTSYRRWSERLREEASSEASRAELDYWRRQIGSDAPELPLDGPRDPGTVAEAEEVRVQLDPERTTALLREVPALYRTQVDDALLAALVEAMEPWTGHRRLRLELESHGRHELFEDVDVSRTVGWFTSTYPVLFDLEGAEGAGAAIEAVKAQLRAVPRHGTGYGVLRYLSPEPEVRESLRWEPEVLFNYLGQLDQALSEDSVFEGAPEDSGSSTSGDNRRVHLLELNCMVSEGSLQIALRYGRRSHRRETMEALGRRYIEALEALIEHCQSGEAGSLRADDFPLAGLSQDQLDALFEDEDDQ